MSCLHDSAKADIVHHNVAASLAGKTNQFDDCIHVAT